VVADGGIQTDSTHSGVIVGIGPGVEQELGLVMLLLNIGSKAVRSRGVTQEEATADDGSGDK
jgi:hypothetical protein